MTTGVILTAGTATRLDNKVLLPIKEGAMFESALLFLMRCEVEEIVIVQDSRRLIEAYWKIRQEAYEPCPPVRFVMQRFANGVTDAISRAAPLVEDWGIVTFGDNLYSQWGPVGMKFDEEYCTVVRHRNSKEDLDRYTPANTKRQWEERDPESTHSEYLAGYLHLRRVTMEEAGGELIEFLNYHKIPGRNVPQVANDKWMDLGTTESYQTYLRLWEIHEA